MGELLFTGMKRRNAILALGSTLSSGCLSLRPGNGDSHGSTDSNGETGDGEINNGSDSEISDVELNEIRDLGGPFEGPNGAFVPSFTWDGKFGGTGKNGPEAESTIMLVSEDGEPVWESDSIEAQYSFAGHFLGSEVQHFVWFTRDENEYVRAFSPANGTELWTHKATNADDDRTLDEITAVDGTICYTTEVGDGNRFTIHRLTEDGETDWEKTVQNDGHSQGLLGDGTVIYAANSTDLQLLNAESGAMQQSWRIRPSFGGLHQHGNVLYVDTSSGIAKFDLEDPGIVWHIQKEFLSGSSFHNAIDVQDGSVFHGSEAGWVNAFSTTDGSHEWETRLPGQVSEIFVGENIIWGIAEEDLYVLDQTTGAVVTRYKEGQFRDIQVIGDRAIFTDYDSATLYEVEEITAG